MRPAVCKTNLRVHIPMDTEDCDYWLVYTENINMVENPDRNHAYLDSSGIFWVWNGSFKAINDPIIYWGNIRGTLANQTDLANELAKAIIGVSVNGTELTKSGQKVSINIPITTISKNGTQLPITNHNVNITLSEYALKTDIPTKLSQLEDDGVIPDVPITSISKNGTVLPINNKNVNIGLSEYALKTDIPDIPILTISKNGTVLPINNKNVNISLSEYALDTDIPTKLSQLQNDMGYGTPPTKVSQLQNDLGYVTQATVTSMISMDWATDTDVDNMFVNAGLITAEPSAPLSPVE